MRINFTMCGMELSGGTRVIFEVANRLIERGHYVHFTTLGMSRDHEWFPLKADITYIETPKLLNIFRKFVMRKFYPKWSYDVEKVLVKSIPDCDINIATFWSTVYPTLKSGKGKMFYYVQHYEPIFAQDRYSRLMARLSYLLPMKKLVVSHWLERLMRSFNQQTVYVGNGVNTDVFYPRDVKHQKSEKLVMAIFRGAKWKGDADVIEAMSILYKKMPNIRLLGVGNKKALKELVKGRKIGFVIDFIDSPDDDKLAELYSSADIFVFASWCEGFGLPPLESMACGTPVVTTNNLGASDYAVDGRNALMVPPRNPKALAESTMKVLKNEDLANSLKRHGLETAKSNNWEKVVVRVEGGFKEVS